MRKPLITLSSDFGPGNVGCGAMEAVAASICSEATIVHLCHNITPYDIREGARILECVARTPVGFHVCVVDPGVGTDRRGIVVQTGRGDFLVGPDNGLLLPAATRLEGVKGIWILENETYQNHPVSPIFHGRDVFSPAAAFLANGIDPSELGPSLAHEMLAPPPYKEAFFEGNELCCEVIHINGNGSLFLNLLADTFHQFSRWGETVFAKIHGKKVALKHQRTFGEVTAGAALILDDDFGRVEVAVNCGNFAKEFSVERGTLLSLTKN